MAAGAVVFLRIHQRRIRRASAERFINEGQCSLPVDRLRSGSIQRSPDREPIEVFNVSEPGKGRLLLKSGDSNTLLLFTKAR